MSSSAYPPGSFSKNFGWHGTGMRKLHAAMVKGFGGALAPVQRQSFRSLAGLDSSLILIPINFFLHNHDFNLSVDELVYQALGREHSKQFDHLALFALNLNRVGGGHDMRSGREIPSRPAMWANEFVRERLWSGGTWHKGALQDASIDRFLAERMNAEKDVRVKCRNNYRHLFELCGYLSSTLTIVNSGAEQWIGSALFLAWDRHILDGGAREKSNLLELIEADELYKLLGVTQGDALTRAELLADLYESAGGLERFAVFDGVPLDGGSTSSPPSGQVGEGTDLEWLEQEASDGIVERRSVERKEQMRDRRAATALKRHYDNTCQFCGIRLEVAQSIFYSEAAHIKGIGEPHNGPDKVTNMLVLCPNHHLQFDRGILLLRKTNAGYQIKSKAQGHQLGGRMITLKHFLDDACVSYHFDWFA